MPHASLVQALAGFALWPARSGLVKLRSSVAIDCRSGAAHYVGRNQHGIASLDVAPDSMHSANPMALLVGWAVCESTKHSADCFRVLGPAL